MHPSPSIAVVAGEASGDLLGAALLQALHERLPGLRVRGLAGPRMREAGCVALGDAGELAVMGLVEPLRHLPRLFGLRRRLREAFLAPRADLFIGIDSPAFNLGLARQLRQRGMRTIQYVSPQVWAWRRGRVRGIARAVDAVLCLLPFEPAAYAGQPVRAEFVGHPLADQVPLQPQRALARDALGIDADATVVAVLPGSRMGEVQRLGADFARAVALLQRRWPGKLAVLAPMVSPALGAVFTAQLAQAGCQARIISSGATGVLSAADAALVASGTATLETMLHGVPMVVAYRLAPLTAFIARDLGLVKLRHFSLPNLLAGETLVPEFFQDAVRPEALAEALFAALTDSSSRARLKQRFHALHELLRRDGAARAADVVLDLLSAAVHRGAA